MNYEWDAAKNITNQIKHGISFEEARLIFEGDVLTGVDGRRDYGETRYMSIGAIQGIDRDRRHTYRPRRHHPHHLSPSREPQRKAKVS